MIVEAHAVMKRTKRTKCDGDLVMLPSDAPPVVGTVLDPAPPFPAFHRALTSLFHKILITEYMTLCLMFMSSSIAHKI